MVALRMEGSRTLRTDRRVVWDALTDVDCLKLCISGCESVTRLSQTCFAVVVSVSLGPARISFRGSIEIRSSDPPRSYHIAGRGEGGFTGMAAGSAWLRLSDVPNGCRLGYVIEAEAAGPLAMLGALFITGVAKTLTHRFLTSLADRLEGGWQTGRASAPTLASPGLDRSPQRWTSPSSSATRLRYLP